jgi:hypothetical protein
MTTMKAKDKAMIASYLRSVIGALIAVYSTGTTDPRDFGKGAIAAIIPPLLRWVNPKDSAFGRDNSQS